MLVSARQTAERGKDELMASRRRRNTPTDDRTIEDNRSSFLLFDFSDLREDLFAAGHLSARDRGAVARAGVKVTRRDINIMDNDYDKTQRAGQFPVQAKCRVAHSVSLSGVSISFGGRFRRRNGRSRTSISITL